MRSTALGNGVADMYNAQLSADVRDGRLRGVLQIVFDDIDAKKQCEVRELVASRITREPF